MTAPPDTRRGSPRGGGPVGRLRLRARAMRRRARERRLSLPTALVVVGSASSGREEVVSLLGESPSLRVAGSPEFLPGLCRWFPNMERLVGSVVRPRANESAAYHVRRMLKDVLESGPPGVPVLPLEPGAEAAGHVEASTIVPTLLSEAVFLLVVRHPVDEFADARVVREGLTPDAFALEWAGAVREWLGVALRRGRDSFVLVRGPRFAIHLERLEPGRAILLGARRPRTLPLVHWMAFPELGHGLGPVLERVGLPAGSAPAVVFADSGPGSGQQPSAEDRRRIVEICGREMMALRMLTGSDFQDVVPYLDPRDEPGRAEHARG